jgi:hypothetical protein
VIYSENKQPYSLSSRPTNTATMQQQQQQQQFQQQPQQVISMSESESSIDDILDMLSKQTGEMIYIIF